MNLPEFADIGGIGTASSTRQATLKWSNAMTNEVFQNAFLKSAALDPPRTISTAVSIVLPS